MTARLYHLSDYRKPEEPEHELFDFYPPDFPIRLCACPERKKEPTLTEKLFKKLREWI